jgi:hypothetical protein
LTAEISCRCLPYSFDGKIGGGSLKEIVILSLDKLYL